MSSLPKTITATNGAAAPPVTASAYAPASADPMRLATVTMQAVDRIGAATAEQIETTAVELEIGAKEVADKLRELGAAIRGHSELASKHITDYCEKAMSVLENVATLQVKLTGAEPAAANVEIAAEHLRIPAFLMRERERATAERVAREKRGAT